VPTIADAGLRGYLAAAWSGVLVPARTPAPIVRKLHADFRQAAQVPQVVQIQSQLMIEPTISASPAEFEAFLDRERRKWGDVARRSGAKVE
jgi:tripartite-type tricarboxylate transporter receptor subunit TctC